jgi:hypothetical protein
MLNKFCMWVFIRTVARKIVFYLASHAYLNEPGIVTLNHAM